MKEDKEKSPNNQITEGMTEIPNLNQIIKLKNARHMPRRFFVGNSSITSFMSQVYQVPDLIDVTDLIDLTDVI